MKLNLDKYYTDKELAKYCIDIAFDKLKDITEVIEPSAGNGSFSLQIPNCIAYDIEPEHESIIRQDFLQLNLPYKKGRLIIGNPPFGVRNILSVKFYKKAVRLCDYIAFILPISQLNNNKQMFDFDLIYSEDLGIRDYKVKNLHCCFNIYKRPKNRINSRHKDKINGITIVEYRRNITKNIAPNFDYSMGCFGNGGCGVIPKYVGNFSNELYFYITHPMKNKILEVLKNTNWKSISKGISNTYGLPQWKVLKELNERIPNLNNFEKVEVGGQKVLF